MATEMSDSDDEGAPKRLLLHLCKSTPSAPSQPTFRVQREEKRAVNDSNAQGCKSQPKNAKGKPLEVSNRRPRAPDAVLRRKKKKKEECRDPRFSELSGNLDLDMFGKAYGFLNEYREKEKSILKKVAPRNGDARTQLERMEQQDKRRLKLGKRSELKHRLNAEEKEKVKDGKTPYFHSEVDIKKRLKREEFEAIKGDKEKFLAKKRKRAAGKEKKLLPARRD